MVKRIVWLSGGLVAVSDRNDRRVQLLSGLRGTMLAEFVIDSFPNLYSELVRLSLNVVGASFVEHPQEMDDRWPPVFRAYFGSNDGWLAHDVHTIWREVANAAGKCDEMTLMDIAARVATGVASCELRLEQLARAYSSQLRGRILDGNKSGSHRFQDLNTRNVHLAVHAMFWELAVLRDVMAEFAATYIFAADNVKTLAGLVKWLRRTKSAHTATADLLSAANDDGWIGVFTSYRNLFTHGAPINQVKGVAFANQDDCKLTSGLVLPRIHHYLPEDPALISMKRSRGPTFNTFEEFAKNRTDKRRLNPELDALNYLQENFLNFVRLSRSYARFSPIDPAPLVIRQADIIGPITVEGNEP